MRQDKLFTVREVAQILNLTEKEVIERAEKGEIPAYKVAGMYLRFNPQQIEEIKKDWLKRGSLSLPSRIPFKEKIIDFFYFNDFYIFSIIVIICLIMIILGAQQ